MLSNNCKYDWAIIILLVFTTALFVLITFVLTFCVFLFTAICSFRVINNKYAEYKVTPVPTKPPIKSPYVPKTSFSILGSVVKN